MLVPPKIAYVWLYNSDAKYSYSSVLVPSSYFRVLVTNTTRAASPCMEQAGSERKGNSDLNRVGAERAKIDKF